MTGQSHNAGRAIKVHPADNVATVIETAPGGTRFQVTDKTGGDGLGLTSPGPVETGHKIALAALDTGDPIVKYGEIMGRATAPIAPGDHVHVHNVESNRGKGK